MDEQINKAKQTQIDKYGGESEYRAEMRRRRSLVKNPGFASMDPAKRLAAARLGGANRYKNKDNGQDEQTQKSRQPS